MEIKVKSLDSVPEKSTQEVEENLLKKHEQENNDKSTDVVEEQPVEQVAEDSAVESPTIKDEDVLSYIGKRYGREINSLDELSAAREEAEELPLPSHGEERLSRPTVHCDDSSVRWQSPADARPASGRRPTMRCSSGRARR